MFFVPTWWAHSASVIFSDRTSCSLYILETVLMIYVYRSEVMFSDPTSCSLYTLETDLMIRIPICSYV